MIKRGGRMKKELSVYMFFIGVFIILSVIIMSPISGWAYNLVLLQGSNQPLYFHYFPSTIGYFLIALSVALVFAFIASTIKIYMFTKKVPLDVKLFLIILVVSVIMYFIVGAMWI